MAREGIKFEVELCKLLSERLFWAHRFFPNEIGAQPFDVIAVKNNQAYGFECKVVASAKKFPLSRVEVNQIYGMERFCYSGNTNAYFAFLRADGSIWISGSSSIVNAFGLAQHGLGPQSIESGTIPLERWFEEVEDKNRQ